MVAETLGPAELHARIDALPRVQLAHLPTPLDDCPRAGEALGLGTLSIKRDDCTGLGLGGNKVRHHEFILGDAVANNCDTLIQGSASQSNHSRQLAAAGAKLGLEVHLLPKLDAHSQPVQGNYLVSHLFGATMHPLDPAESTIDAKNALAEKLRAEGRTPYVIGMGAERSLLLAAVAYVEAFLELVEQVPEGRLPDVIVTCSQGSNQAGLLLAARALGFPTRIVGINPLDKRHEAFLSHEQITQIVRDAAALLGLQVEIAPQEVENSTEFVGDGYGIPSPAGLDALHFLGTTEGILLDPVYTSKAFAGLRALAPDLAAQRVTFLHTGGIPALFAYAEQVCPSDASANRPNNT